MTNRRKRVYEIALIVCCLIIIGLTAYMGITAVQKSMRLNVGFSAVPSIKVLIQIEDPQADDGYRTIFRNDANTQIGAGLEIHGNTLQFTSSFADSEPNIGASFVLKFTNLMTNTGLKASVIGNSATANPTYVTMKESGSGQDTATMTVSGSSDLATLQLMFSEYNVYTVSFSGPSVSNATVEVGSGEAYSTTLTPKEGYNIPSSVSITVGGVAIDSNSYSYTPSTGALTINKEAITGDVVITAVSTLAHYTITYNLDGGTNHASNPTTYTIEDTITLQAPIKDGGYMFGGWTGSNGETPETSVTIPQGSTGNKTYTVSSWTLGDYILMTGQSINAKIKQQVSTSSGSGTYDRTITGIIFGKYSNYKDTVPAWSQGKAVDADSSGYIRLFPSNADNTTQYILSDGDIYTNTDCSYMFQRFCSATSIVLDNFNTLNSTNMAYMFNGCEKVTVLNVSNFNTSKVTNMSNMLAGLKAVTSLNLTNFNTSNVEDMSRMFHSTFNLTSLNIDNFDTSKVTNMSEMFEYCYDLLSINTAVFNTSSVVGAGMNSMFADCRTVTALNLTNFNTSNVTDMSFMFFNCESLTSITFPANFGSAATDMGGMFSSCDALTSLDLSNLNTSSVTDMGSMFSSCSALTSLGLSNLNTSSVTDMSKMFQRCSNLTSLDLRNFNTSKVTDMNQMFRECEKLTNITFPTNFGSAATDMSDMFYKCSGLTSLDLSNFNTSKVTDMTTMFFNCSNLTTIYVSNSWSTANVTSSSNMFYGCTSLVGGNGRTYNSTRTNKTYANYETGYFTLKN